MRVKVYFNLHKKKFSIQHKGKVFGHSESVYLENVRFKVNQSGRLRVLREKRKNVHAFVIGELLFIDLSDSEKDTLKFGAYAEATYNPYKYESFVLKETLEKVESADSALLDGNRIFLV